MPATAHPHVYDTLHQACAALGTRLQALVRGKPIPMEVTAMPFVPHRYARG